MRPLASLIISFKRLKSPDPKDSDSLHSCAILYLHLVLSLCIMPSIMDRSFYQGAFEKAIDDLAKTTSQREELDAQRARLNVQIENLREGVLGLAVLCGSSRSEIETKYPDLFPNTLNADVGLTDAIRIVLRTDPEEWLSPVQISQRLTKIGFDLSKYTNPLATIHTTLKRLFDNDEIDTGIHEGDGKTLYRGWVENDEKSSRKPEAATSKKPRKKGEKNN